MSAAHTPGPWAWEEGQPNITKSWNGKYHQVACVDYRKLAWHEDSNCAGRESGANARLIAAAPELLDELRKLRRAYVNLLEGGRDRILQLGGDCDPLDAMASSDPYLRSAAAAIDKATKAIP